MANQPTLALVGGTILDGNGGAPLADGTILIQGNRIREIGPRSSVQVPQDAQIIDTTGKFVLPGFIDLHVHFKPWMGELFLTHGVTSIKDLGNEVVWTSTLAEDVESGRMRGPRIFYVGNGLDVPPAVREHYVCFEDPATAKKVVKALHSRGVCAIKVREKMTPDLLRAVTEQAHELGLPVTGHIRETDAREAALADIDGLEHMTGITDATVKDKPPIDPSWSEARQVMTELTSFAQIDESSLKQLIELMVSKDVALVPTMATWWRASTEHLERFAKEDAAYAEDPGLAYLPKPMKQMFASSAIYQVKNQELLSALRAAHEKACQIVRQHAQAGGKVLAGSDTLVSVPGINTHRELMMFVEAGFSPSEVIPFATRDNARHMGKGDELGTLEAGKLADLFVCSADPLADISNTQQVEHVVKDGQLVDRAYTPDYSIPHPEPDLTRPLWVERQLGD